MPLLAMTIAVFGAISVIQYLKTGQELKLPLNLMIGIRKLI